MARRMTDDEIEDFTYNKMFGDLDNIHSGALFDEDGEGEGVPQEIPAIAGKPGIEGIELTIKPVMAATAESAKPVDDDEEEEEQDKLKGISKLSPIMEQLHGNR